MEQAGHSLWSALRRVARPEKPLDLLVAVWPLMVGKRLAGHTRPVAWSKGRVAVAVDEPEWHKELQGMSKDVRKQINRWWGSELVTEVRFVTDKSKRQAPSEARKSSVGGLKARPHSGPEKSTPSENKLSAALKDLEPALRGIGDAELRDLISRVASKYLDKDRSRQDPSATLRTSAGATQAGKQEKK